MKFSFTTKPIAVIGDLILDEYVYGTATRLSPEAPVPVIARERSEYRLGGAGNVAANLKALGANVFLASVIGTDDTEHDLPRKKLLHAVNELGIEYKIRYDGTRCVTHKVRLIANNQQIARVDKESTHEVDPSNVPVDAMFECKPAAIIISDYAKGVISNTVLTRIRATAAVNGIPVFIDPKIAHKRMYAGRGFAVITPNLHEAEGLTGHTTGADIASLGRSLCCMYDCSYALVTQGAQGMTLLNALGTNLHLSSKARSVFDVSGAGDTVIATLALAYASSLDMTHAANLANHAAGIVVGKAGTAVVTLDELTAVLANSD